MQRLLLPLPDSVQVPSVVSFALLVAEAFHLGLAAIALGSGDAKSAAPPRSRRLEVAGLAASAGVSFELIEVAEPLVRSVVRLTRDSDVLMMSSADRASGPWIHHNPFETLMRRSPVPVWAVPETAGLPRRLVVAYDAHPRALQAVRLAVTLSRQWSLPLSVLVVTEGKEVDERDVGYALEELYAQGLREHEVFYEQGPPWERIGHHAQPDGLLVMGSHGHGAPLGLRIGHTVDRVLGAATGSVLFWP